MNAESCPACGSFDTYEYSECRTYAWDSSAGYKSTMVELTFNKCKSCGEEGDFNCINDDKIIAAGIGK